MALTVWRVIFWIAAFFNFAAGLPPFLAPESDSAGFGYAQDPQTLIVVRLMGLLIAMFGVGYVIVALNPLKNHGIVLMGAIGKLGVVILVVEAYTRGLVPQTAALMTMGDLVFVALFTWFLASRRTAA